MTDNALAEALRFYADPKNWKGEIRMSEPNTIDFDMSPAMYDGGAVARAALAAHDAAPWTPPSVRTWSHYPIQMPVTADGKGPATIGVDAVAVKYEVWEAEPPHHSVASFDNLPDAINEAMRLSFAPLPDAPGEAP